MVVLIPAAMSAFLHRKNWLAMDRIYSINQAPEGGASLRFQAGAKKGVI